MKMRATALFLFVLAFVVAAGCSTAWEKRGVGAAQVVADTDECRAAARGGRLELQETLSGRATLLLPVSELDHRAFGDCMRQRGYVKGLID